MISELIGWQIISMNNEGFVVSKNGQKKTFEFCEDYGDCCGFNDLEAKLFYEEGSNENPVITSIRFEDVTEYDEEHIVITFFSAYKTLAQIDSLSSSGSGWQYGACVTCKCIETGEEELISQW